MKHARAAVVSFVAGIAAIAAVAWVFLRDDSTRSPLALDRAGAAAPVVDATATESDAADPDRAAVPQDAIAAASRDTLVENPPPFAGPTLHFVEAETGHPCADAEAWLVRRGEVDEEEWDAFGRWDAEVEPLITERGHLVELDAFATATLDGARDEAMVFGDWGERHLRRSIALDTSDRIVLRFVRREALTLVAVDPDGRRQRDVPLSLQTLLRGDPWRPPARLRWRQTTDRDGEASLSHGSALLDEHLDADGLATAQVLVAALDFPCRDPHTTLVDPRTACEQPLLIETPPRATLKLRAIAPDGRPLPCPVTVRAWLATPPPATCLPIRRAWTVTVDAGATREWIVEAEESISLEAWSEDGHFGMEARTVLAPGRAGASDVDLVLQRNETPTRPGWMNCTATVLEPGGAPLASKDLFWQLDGGDMPLAGTLQPGRTDEKAILRFQCRRSEAGSQDEREIDVFDGVETPLSRGAKWHGSRKFPGRVRAEPFHIGTIKLHEVPVLVAGRVVDVEGRGLLDVQIKVTEWLAKPDSWTTKTSLDGSFSLRSPSDARRLEVWPSRAHWYRENEYDVIGRKRPIECPAGTLDLAITLHRKGFARGRLQVDPGISLRDLELTALPRQISTLSVRLEPDGRFVAEGRPATFSLAVWAHPGREQPVRQVDHVVLREGEETVDPRLDPIDLLRDLRQVELWVRSASDGAPVADANIFLTRNRGFGRARRATDPFGRALVTTDAFDAALAVVSPEFMLQQVGFERTPEEVALSPAIVARVKVEGGGVELFAEKLVSPAVHLEKAAGGELMRELWSQLPRPRARRVDECTFEFLATVAGTYALNWMGKEDPWERIGPETRVNVSGDRAVVELVEKFSDDEVKRLAAQLRN